MASSEAALAAPLLADETIERSVVGVSRRGSVTGVEEDYAAVATTAAGIGREQLEIEDALDRLGGIGKFQLIQFFFAGMFWFLSPSILFSVFANGPCIGARQVCEYDSANTGSATDCCADLRGFRGAESCVADPPGACYELEPGSSEGACATFADAGACADAGGGDLCAWTTTCWATNGDGVNAEISCDLLGAAATSYEDALEQCTGGGGVLGMGFPDCDNTCPDPFGVPGVCPDPVLNPDPDPLPGEPPGEPVCPLIAPNREYWSRCTNIACQFDLTGSRAFIRPLLDSSFFLGWLWGAPVSGRFSDRFGRYRTLYLTFALNAFGAISSAFATGPYWYMFSRHLTGAGLGGSSLTAYLIGTEYAPRSRVTRVKAAWALFSVCGYIWQSFFNKYLFYSLPGYNWRLQHLILFAPYFTVTIVSSFVLCESPRWLIVNRGVGAATAALAKVAQRNGTTAEMSTFVLRSVGSVDDGKKGESGTASAAAGQPGQGTDGLRELFCVPSLRRQLLATLVLWFAAAFSYYGITLRAEALPGNVFDVFAIMSSVEAPAVLLLVPMLNARPIGRRGGTLGLFFCLGVGSFVNMVWRTSTGRLTLNIAGRAFSGAAFSAVYVWSTEIFPSSLRHTAMGLGSMSARIGSVIAPFTVNLWEAIESAAGFDAPDGPLLLFGTAGIVAGVIGFLFLPETRGRVTFETVADMLLQEQQSAQRKTTCCCCK
jgi:MFS family permease